MRSGATTVSELIVEPMQLEDVPEVMAVDRLCFPTPWSEISYRSEIGNNAAYYLVARLEGRLIGFGGAWLVMDEAHVTTLGVDPAFRGRKIGERVLAAILAEARRRGVRRASLEVRESNTAAVRLYEKYGFVPVARRRGYYTDNGEDAIVMWIEDMARVSYQELLRERLAILSEAVHARTGD
jgi:[ribosomal protein S18]-alanine N-acetyltransferase